MGHHPHKFGTADDEAVRVLLDKLSPWGFQQEREAIKGAQEGCQLVP
jgi:hypothetical protein